jgi:hypothetical protein
VDAIGLLKRIRKREKEKGKEGERRGKRKRERLDFYCLVVDIVAARRKLAAEQAGEGQSAIVRKRFALFIDAQYKGV